MPGMDALLELERLNEGETPTNVTDPAVWAANLLEPTGPRPRPGA